jgi:hypothetical protein
MDHIENAALHCFGPTVALLKICCLAMGTCLPSRCPGTALLYPLISRSLPSNGSTRYGIVIIIIIIFFFFWILSSLWIYCNPYILVVGSVCVFRWIGFEIRATLMGPSMELLKLWFHLELHFVSYVVYPRAMQEVNGRKVCGRKELCPILRCLSGVTDESHENRQSG